MFTKRQIALLLLLEEQIDWITSADVGQLSGCSYKTVQNDVQVLIELLPEGWHIERMKGKGMKLVKPLNERVTSALPITHRDQLEYEIIEKIATGQMTTLDDLSKSVFVNVNSLHLSLKDIDTRLAEYSLTLSRNPLQLMGDESYIRYYLYQLKKEMHGESRLFYTSYDGYEQYVETFKQLGRKLGIILYPLPLNNLLQFVDIAITRIKAGFYATIDEQVKKSAMNNTFYHEMDEFFLMVEENHSISIHADERVLLFLASIHSDFTFLEIVERPDKIILSIQENQATLAFVTLLEQKLGLSLRNNTNLLLGLYDFEKKLRLRYGLTKELIATKRESSLLIQELYGHTYTQLDIICTEWMIHHHYLQLSSEAISDLTLLVEQAKLDTGYDKKRALLISSENYQLGQFTRTFLEKHFSGRMDLISESLGNSNRELVDKLAIDFVISDTPLDLIDVKVVLINRIPTAKDLANIEYVLCQA